VNKRTDKWGGPSLDNRQRFLVEIIKKIREECGSTNFIVGLKVNTSDFVKDGFSNEDCTQLLKNLDQ